MKRKKASNRNAKGFKIKREGFKKGEGVQNIEPLPLFFNLHFSLFTFHLFTHPFLESGNLFPAHQRFFVDGGL